MTLVAGVLTGCQPEELSPMSGNPDSSGSSSVTKAAGDPLESLHRNEFHHPASLFQNLCFQVETP